MEKVESSSAPSPKHSQQPNQTLESMSIQRLLGKDVLEEIQDQIAKATGLAFVSVDYKGEPITELTSFTPFCQRMRYAPGTGQNCKQSDAFGVIQAAVTKRRNVFFCPCGLLEVAVPIIVQGQYLGGVLGGQFRCTDAPPDIPRLAGIVPQPDAMLQQDKELQQLFEQVPHIHYEQFTHLADLVAMIINQFAEKEITRLQQTHLLTKQIQTLNERQRLAEKEHELRRRELGLLRAQMDPFLMLRCLNTISNLSVLENAPQTNEVITLFSNFLYSLFTDNHPVITIAEECETLNQYLQIQEVRLSNKLTWNIEMDESMRIQPIPRMILLPFVERALEYGIVPKQGPGHITIHFQYQKQDVVVQIEDDGPGLDIRAGLKLGGKSEKKQPWEFAEVGIHNARTRLISMFGYSYDIVIKTMPQKGTISTIRYPKDFDERIFADVPRIDC